MAKSWIEFGLLRRARVTCSDSHDAARHTVSRIRESQKCTKSKN